MKLLFAILILLLNTNRVTMNSMPILDLYNTGVDDARNVLPDGTTDYHYRLIKSADINYPGPDAKISLSTGFPMDRWVPNSNISKWIAPRTDAINFNEPGLYVYRIQFDLSKFKSKTAIIQGLWSTDNDGIDILINGKSTGYITPIEAYLGMFPFEINDGFVDGINTLDFAVNNYNAPTGLRVELRGMAEPKEYVSQQNELSKYTLTPSILNFYILNLY